MTNAAKIIANTEDLNTLNNMLDWNHPEMTCYIDGENESGQTVYIARNLLLNGEAVTGVFIFNPEEIEAACGNDDDLPWDTSLVSLSIED